jgi:hypothetical protein
MPKLTYWAAERLDDSKCYSLIGKTRKAVQEQLDELNRFYQEEQTHLIWHAKFGPIEKHVIIYKDAFALLDMLTGEGGGRV